MLIINKIKLLLVILLLVVPIYILHARGEEQTLDSVTLQTAEQVVEEEQVIIKEPTYVELVEQFSEEYGVNPILAKAIIKCESGTRSTGLDDIQEYQRTIQNPYSSASGFAQFINGTWSWTIERMGLPSDTDKHDPVISIQVFVWLLSKDGTSHWLESKSCWSTLV